MKKPTRIYISIAAVSFFSFLTGADIIPAGTDRLLTLPKNGAGSERTPYVKGALNSDLAITSRIREEITASKNLSINAKKVKIITIGGSVVLKGMVISEQEKRIIGNIAIGVQRKENVYNRLVVGSAPSAPTGMRVVQ